MQHLLCSLAISSENRYLLFLTENYAALDILKHYVSGEEANDLDLTSQPYILFGSSFPKDKGYTQVQLHAWHVKAIIKGDLAMP